MLAEPRVHGCAMGAENQARKCSTFGYLVTLIDVAWREGGMDSIKKRGEREGPRITGFGRCFKEGGQGGHWTGSC
jgi:hypothetical protein